MSNLPVAMLSHAIERDIPMRLSRDSVYQDSLGRVRRGEAQLRALLSPDSAALLDRILDELAICQARLTEAAVTSGAALSAGAWPLP